MDMDIILLTAVISTLFIVFIIAVYREFAVMESETYVFQKESGPRAGLVNFVGNLAANKSLTPEEKKVIYQVNGCFVLCAKYRNQDLAHTKTYRYTDSHGNIQTAEHLYWTEKGRELIIRMYQQFKKAS